MKNKVVDKIALMIMDGINAGFYYLAMQAWKAGYEFLAILIAIFAINGHVDRIMKEIEKRSSYDK